MKRFFASFAPAALGLVLGLAAPFAGAAAPGDYTYRAAQAPLPGVNHVILIGFDGFGAYAYEKAEMPRLKALVKSGASSFTTRTVLPSASAPNWAAHLMSAGPELTGYTQWGTRKPVPVSVVTNKWKFFPGILGELRLQKPDSKLGVVYNWDGIGFLYEQKASDFNQFTDTMEQTGILISNFIKKEKPTFAFVHFHEPDVVGHKIGHNTPEYYAELKGCDRELGRVLDAIREAGMEKDTVVMVIADHGGINKGHGSTALVEMQTPWVIAGPGVKKNYTIKEPVMNMDTGATIARVFGLKTPSVWRGRSVDEVFESTK